MRIEVIRLSRSIGWFIAVFLLVLSDVCYASSYTLYIKPGIWTINGSGGASL
jgi:hypothetical protein